MTEQTEPNAESVKDEMDAGMVAAMADLADATARLEKFQDTTGTWGTGAQADLVALIQDLKARLGLVEAQAVMTLGKSAGAIQGNLSDGRQFTLKRAADRTAWDHEEWKRDARRAIVQAHAGSRLVIDTDTGEEAPLARVLQEAITEAQEVHGSTAPRSTSLKRLGLYANDYCTSTPGGWRFNALKPTTTEDKD